MIKQTIHLFQISENHNTACGRDSIISSKHEEYVTCKKCLGHIKAIIKNTPKRHLMVQAWGRDFKHYNTACHTVRWSTTLFYEAVTCQKCIYILKKSLKKDKK